MKLTIDELNTKIQSADSCKTGQCAISSKYENPKEGVK